MSGDGRDEDLWYYVDEQNASVGPVGRSALLGAYQKGRIGPGTLVWTGGMGEWQPLAVVFPEAVPYDVTAIGPAEEGEGEVGRPVVVLDSKGRRLDEPLEGWPGGHPRTRAAHPWRRYFARTIDLILIGAPTFVAVQVVLATVLAAVSNDGAAAAARLLDVINRPIVAPIVMSVCWIPVEALVLAVFGSTPGRALYGIRLRTAAGRRLSFAQALQREVLVNVQGMGLNVAIVSLFTLVMSYQRLTRMGVTAWDEALGTVVTHTRWSLGRTIVCVTLTLGLFMLLGWLQATYVLVE